MATRLSTNVRNLAAAATVGAIDAGPGAGVVEIRTGTQPASAQDAASGTLLVTITLNDPAFGSPANGVTTMDNSPVPSGTGVADGAVGWARIKDSTGATALDCTASGPGDGGAIELDADTIAVGVTVSITALTYTHPATT